MCGSMVDIQSATAEIRRGEKRKKEEEEEETTGQKYNGLPYYIGRPQKGQVSTAANKVKLCQTKQVYYRRHDTIYHNNTALSTTE